MMGESNGAARTPESAAIRQDTGHAVRIVMEIPTFGNDEQRAKLASRALRWAKVKFGNETRAFFEDGTPVNPEVDQ